MGGRCRLVTQPLLDHLPEIAREIDGASHFFLGLDFDGTLAPIVSDPAEARIPDETLRVLETLGSRPATTIAIISGRALEDLRSRLSFDLILAGNHGLEIREKGVYWRHPDAEHWQPELRKVYEELCFRLKQIPRTLIEDKGLTATVHYRNADPRDVPRLGEMVKAAIVPYRDHFFLRQGRKVIEILPRVDWDKGTAIQRILSQLKQEHGGKVTACYIGDDATDERAFRVLNGDITVRVCQDCLTEARFRVNDPEQVTRFLRFLSRGHVHDAKA